MSEEFQQDQTEGNSFKEIMMRQLNKVLTFSNVEFRGGFYTKTPTKNGDEKEIYVQDTRQVYCNSVHALGLLIKPRFDDKMKPNWDTYLNSVSILEKEFLTKTKLDDDVVLGESYYQNEEKKEWHTLQIKKLVIHHKLFEDLNLQLARLNYLEFGGETFE